ncbi:MAG: ATP-binding protein [Clostridiales bacterium]|jgi:anti-sigma regulatory factor (Ser/Thr protein kinase)|nr:ATP-binding protein [Clostridiales bacterium]
MLYTRIFFCYTVFIMMKELSMHIMDIAENSVRANSPVVKITIEERRNSLSILIEDEGDGMTPEMAEKALDPFVTTRNTRKVGLGLPFLKQTCEQCGGKLTIESALGKGVKVVAEMERDNIDRPPMGDLADCLRVLIAGRPDVDFIYSHTVDDKAYAFDTTEVKKELDGLSIAEPAVAKWLYDELRAGIDELYA